jgi:hypothetical protein
MQRKRKLAFGELGSDPFSEAAADGMESEIISGLAGIGRSY